MTDFVSTVSRILNEDGLINFDLADVYSILGYGGCSSISTGAASESDHAESSRRGCEGLKINNPGFLFTRFIVFVEGSDDMSSIDIEDAVDIISRNQAKTRILFSERPSTLT